MNQHSDESCIASSGLWPWSLDILSELAVGGQPGGLAEGSRWSSGQRGNDHRKTASDGPAPQRGARPGMDAHNRLVTTAQHFTLEQPQSRSAAVTTLAPQPGWVNSPARLPGGRRPVPPATSGYLLLTLRVHRSRMSRLQGLWPAHAGDDLNLAEEHL